MKVGGVFMVPNAFPFNLTGSGAQDLTNAQYIVRGFAVAGGATLYERGLATAVLGRRAGALSRLERGGVNVLDAAPELLTAEIVHRFRALRAGGVL